MFENYKRKRKIKKINELIKHLQESKIMAARFGVSETSEKIINEEISKLTKQKDDLKFELCNS
jgi:hypothetical protein